MALTFLIILLSSIIIYFSGNSFVKSSSKIGAYFNLPDSIKGATLDAIASSFPELMIAIFSVVIFKHFDVAIGTITGSALFNLLVIPGLVVFVSPKVFKISKDVIAREGMFYAMSVFAFLAAILYSPTWGLFIPFSFLIIYFWYIKTVFRHAKKSGVKIKKKNKKEVVSIPREFILIFLNIFLMGISSFFLTKYAIVLAGSLGIPAIIIAFTIVAATTSGPDAVIAIINAKKGHTDDVTSGIFGSNIFDILVGLSIPLLLQYFLVGGAVNVSFGQTEIVVGLLGATIFVIYLMIEDFILTKKEAVVMLSLYFIFMVYIFNLFL